ncbi:MAG: GRAM domain-containing protein [Brachybacterium sp.]
MSARDRAALPFPLAPGETLVRSGAANMQRGAETAGGKLYLTTERLVFTAHSLNLRSGPSEVPLTEVAEVDAVWTKLLGVLPLLPNSVALTLRDGTVHSFVVTGRGAWIAAITQARGGGAPAR